MQESLVGYYAQNPEEYRAALALDERLVLLADLFEDSPEVETLVDDYVRYVDTSLLTEELRRGPDPASDTAPRRRWAGCSSSS